MSLWSSVPPLLTGDAMQDAIVKSDGYKSLLAATEKAKCKSDSGTEYQVKMDWVIERAIHYGKVAKCNPHEILNSWEKSRDYSYMNYYQDANQPLIDGETVRVFDTVKEAQESIGKKGFRCPSCENVSKSPYRCNAGVKPDCNWTSFGLFRTAGKGVHIFIKDVLKGEELFKPIAWE